mgnify:CR=1 FL=1
MAIGEFLKIYQNMMIGILVQKKHNEKFHILYNLLNFHLLVPEYFNLIKN